MALLQRAAEYLIDKLWIIDAIVNLERVVIHLGAAIRANHFGFGHCCLLVLIGQLLQMFLKVTSPTLRQSFSGDRLSQ